MTAAPRRTTVPGPLPRLSAAALALSLSVATAGAQKTRRASRLESALAFLPMDLLRDGRPPMLTFNGFEAAG